MNRTGFKKAWPEHKKICVKPSTFYFWPDKSHYEVLGVRKHVDATTLKKEYYKVSRAHHPDRNPGDLKAQDKMRQITEAFVPPAPGPLAEKRRTPARARRYEVLSDPKRREAYNRTHRLRADGRNAASP